MCIRDSSHTIQVSVVLVVVGFCGFWVTETYETSAVPQVLALDLSNWAASFRDATFSLITTPCDNGSASFLAGVSAYIDARTEKSVVWL